jgi:GTP-binding protein
MFFVDLPGYGYAKVSKKDRMEWQKWIEEYLVNRKQIRMLILLIDIRHEPTSDDKIMYNWLMSRNVNHVIIANKLDKISRNQINKNLKIIRNAFGINEDINVIPYSSKTNLGSKETWELINTGIELD